MGVIAQIRNPTAKLTIYAGIPANKTKAETETHLVIAEADTSIVFMI